MSKDINKNNNRGANKQSANINDKKKLETKNLVLLITAVVLAVVLVAGIIIAVVINVNKKKEAAFDYITSDLSEYITMNEALYKNYSISLDIAKPRDIDVDVTILNLLASKKGEPLKEGKKYTYGNISAGDIVDIYYRGYAKDSSGNEQYLANMCNFGNASAASLEIGSNQFVPGFELGLAGLDFTAANSLVKITEGAPKDGQIIYVSYVRYPEGSTATSDKVTAVSERIVLGTDDIDKTYGAGVEEKLRSLTVGAKDGVAFKATINNKTYDYSDFKIDFATECEKEETYFLIECYFPYDYTTASLRNQTVYFEVYVQGIVEYEAPEFTDAFIEENLGKDDFGVTEEDLEKYEGSYTEKLRAYLKHLLEEDYKETYRTKLEEAMWNHYHADKVAVIKKYPNIKVQAIYNEYYDDVVYQFEYSGGSITNALGSSVTCETLDEYAVIYLGLEYAENQDWKNVLYTMSESLVKERLILYYIMKEQNLMPTAEELAAQIEASKQEYIDEYIAQYLAEYEKKKSDYTDEEWAQFVEDRKKELFDYYNDDYFTEIAYYEIALEEFLKWPNVTTLDDREVADK